MVFGNLALICGSALFAETLGTPADRWTLPLGYVCFGLGGNIMHLAGFSLANLFPASQRPTLVATLCAPARHPSRFAALTRGTLR